MNTPPTQHPPAPAAPHRHTSPHVATRRTRALALAIALLAALAAPCPAQPAEQPATREITFKDFLDEVARANLDYAAERYNVDLAKAAIAIAREFPNPVLELGAEKDIRNRHRRLPDPDTGKLVSQRMPESRGIGITQTIEWPGKRKWRIRAAESDHRAAAATLDDFARNLKLEAAEAFLQALAARRSLEQQREDAEYVRQLVAVQRQRLKAGDISETDLTQSQVEELQIQADLLNAENEAQAAQLALNALLGRDHGHATLIPVGKLEQEPRTFEKSRLLQALQNRADLVALRHARDAAQNNIRLAKIGRMPDIDIGLGYTHTTASENLVGPTESDNQVGLSVSIPLPLWSRQKGDVQAALFAAGQAEKTLQAAALKAEVHLRSALASHNLMQERVQKFRSGLLEGAAEVLKARRHSYERGETTLLDLLDALRANNAIRQSHTEALAAAAAALLELQRATGLWDVDF